MFIFHLYCNTFYLITLILLLHNIMVNLGILFTTIILTIQNNDFYL